MSAKEFIMDFVKELPDNLSVEDFLYRIVLERKLSLAEDDIRTGRIYSHEEAKEKLKKWLK